MLWTARNILEIDDILSSRILDENDESHFNEQDFWIVLFGILVQEYYEYIDQGLEELWEMTKLWLEKVAEMVGMPVNREMRKQIAKDNKGFKREVQAHIWSLHNLKKWLSKEWQRIDSEENSFVVISESCINKIMGFDDELFPETGIQELKQKTKQLQSLYGFLVEKRDEYETWITTVQLRKNTQEIISFLLKQGNAFVAQNMQIRAENESMQEVITTERKITWFLEKEIQTLTKRYEKMLAEYETTKNSITSLWVQNTKLQRKMTELEGTIKNLRWELSTKQKTIDHFTQIKAEWQIHEGGSFTMEYVTAIEEENSLLKEQQWGFMTENNRLGLRIQALEEYVDVLLSQADTSISSFMSRVEHNIEICSVDDLIKYMLHVDCPYELKNKTIQVILDFFDALLRQTTGWASSSTKGNPGIGGGCYSNNFLKPIINFLKEKGKNGTHPQTFLSTMVFLDWKKIMSEYMGHEWKHKNQMVFSMYSIFPEGNNQFPLFQALQILADSLGAVNEPGVNLIAISQNIYSATEQDGVTKRKLQDIVEDASKQKQR